jgi:TonB family protein
MGFFIQLKSKHFTFQTMKFLFFTLSIFFSIGSLTAQENQDTTLQKTDTTITSEELKNKQDSISKSLGLPPLPAVYPSYPGGPGEMHKFLYANFSYPTEAKEKGIQGRLYVSFLVNTDGSISDIKVVRGLGYGCDEEAIRLVKLMPKWTPGYAKDGTPLKVKQNLPISFKLFEQETSEPQSEKELKKEKKKKEKKAKK